MQIQILSVDIKTVPTAKGSYQTAELAYKNLSFQGKVEGRKIMSFGASASTFKVMAAASSGDVFDIDIIKNEKGFNDWVAAVPSVAGVASISAPAASKGISAPTTATGSRSSYETPEERALRQVLIVRQSNLNAAVSMLTAGAKAPPKLEDVLALAKSFEQYVFGTEPDTSGFDTMTSDDVDVI